MNIKNVMVALAAAMLATVAAPLGAADHGTDNCEASRVMALNAATGAYEGAGALSQATAINHDIQAILAPGDDKTFEVTTSANVDPADSVWKKAVDGSGSCSEVAIVDGEFTTEAGFNYFLLITYVGDSAEVPDPYTVTLTLKA